MENKGYNTHEEDDDFRYRTTIFDYWIWTWFDNMLLYLEQRPLLAFVSSLVFMIVFIATGALIMMRILSS